MLTKDETIAQHSVLVQQFRDLNQTIAVLALHIIVLEAREQHPTAKTLVFWCDQEGCGLWLVDILDNDGESLDIEAMDQDGLASDIDESNIPFAMVQQFTHYLVDIDAYLEES